MVDKMVKNFLVIFACLLALFLPANFAYGQDVSVLKNHDTEQPLDVSADSMRLKQKEGMGFLTGSVRVQQGGMLLVADQVTVFYDSEGGFDNPTIHRMDATGGVQITSASETVTAEWGVYDVSRRLVTLGGSVDYVSKGTKIHGERLELDLVTGSVRLDGEVKDGDTRVRGTFSIPENKKE